MQRTAHRPVGAQVEFGELLRVLYPYANEQDMATMVRQRRAPFPGGPHAPRNLRQDLRQRNLRLQL